MLLLIDEAHTMNLEVVHVLPCDEDAVTAMAQRSDSYCAKANSPVQERQQ